GGGGGTTDTTTPNETNQSNNSSDTTTTPHTTQTVQNRTYELVLDVNETTISTNWRKLLNMPTAKSIKYIEHGKLLHGAKYGNFDVDEDILKYNKTVEINSTDIGNFEVTLPKQEEPIQVTISIKSLYWKEAKCGNSHTIALKSDGTIWSWGYNNNGELGDGTNDDRWIGVEEITHSHDWRSIDAGGWFNMAIKNDGTLWAWGHNDLGQFGNNSDIFTDYSSTKPIKVSNEHWKSIALGQNHVLAIRDNNTLWAWGSNAQGQIGNGGVNGIQKTPYKVGDNYQYITAGKNYSLAMQESGTNNPLAVATKYKFWAWGDNSFGQLGIGSKDNKDKPTLLYDSQNPTWAEDANFQDVVAGAYHTLALQKNKTVWGWGNNGYGELTNNSDGTDEEHSPIKIDILDFVKLSAGENYSMGIKSDGTLWGWGNGQYGNLGDNSTDVNVKFPRQEATKSTKWVYIDTGNRHSIGIQSDGTLWSWGDNNYGQLGNATDNSSSKPIHIMGRYLN
ncbi:MAG TPA: hypothetical protein ENK88_00130, partial [Campylobacterales bacterium]|nr:hypothetical protein [Campylobacterales bacterium]